MTPQQELVKVKCPACEATLRVKADEISNPYGKSITCPKCKAKNPLQDYMTKAGLPLPPKPEPAKPQVPKPEPVKPIVNPGSTGGETIVGVPGKQDDRTIPLPGNIKPKCMLHDIRTHQYYLLNLGVNVLGRDCSSSKATIRINTGECMEMSREHLDITVDYNPLTGHNYYVKLHKQKVNETRVESCGQGSSTPPQQVVLNIYDTLVLNPGDLIHLPGKVTLRLESGDGIY